MLIMARDRSYPDLVDSLRGKKVLIWTCNTCARLCNSIGGDDSAGALADRLRSDGIEISGILSTSASCIVPKVMNKRDSSGIQDYDVILSLTCDIGAKNAASVFGKETVNPVITYGPGYINEHGEPVLSDGSSVGKMMSPYL